MPSFTPWNIRCAIPQGKGGHTASTAAPGAYLRVSAVPKSKAAITSKSPLPVAGKTYKKSQRVRIAHSARISGFRYREAQHNFFHRRL